MPNHHPTAREHDNQHDHQHQHQHDPQHGAGDWDDSAMAELLDLDAEVLQSYLSEVTSWIGSFATPLLPHRILDVGSGTGTGSFALLRQFPSAEVLALDVSPGMLAHLQRRAHELGLDTQVRTQQADLDRDWPAVEPVDLVWASSSLHHMADPSAALAKILSALRPGGLLVAAELTGFPRFLPDDLGFGPAGFEERLHALLDGDRAAHLPHIGSDWGSLLSATGFEVLAERAFDIDLRAPLPEAVGRYARASLQRARPGVADRLGPEDLATYDRLLDDGPQSITHRDDVTVRTTRSVWVARRP